MASLPDGIRAHSVGVPYREGGTTMLPVGLEMRIDLVAGGRTYELGWVSGPEQIPALLRAAADQLEEIRRG